MGSEKRQRPVGVFVRMHEHEKAWLAEQAAAAKCTPAELIRALIFERAPQRTAPCSPAHPACTPHHRDLVDGYRDQRYREELAVEAMTGGYAGDRALLAENGHRLTTFHDWLRGRTA